MHFQAFHLLIGFALVPWLAAQDQDVLDTLPANTAMAAQYDGMSPAAAEFRRDTRLGRLLDQPSATNAQKDALKSLLSQGGPVAAARALLGDTAWIGRTIRSDAEFHAALPDLGRAGADRLDYFGMGTIYGTTTKTGLSPKGPEFLRPYTALCADRIYPIGGIDASKGAELRAVGARHAAVASSLLTARETLEEARKLLLELQGTAGGTSAIQ